MPWEDARVNGETGGPVFGQTITVGLSCHSCVKSQPAEHSTSFFPPTIFKKVFIHGRWFSKVDV